LATGVAVTPERLARVDAAERFLRERGFSIVRVRLHDGELARIEVPGADLPRLIDLAPELHARLQSLGFRFVSVDLGGFQSGGLNVLVPLEVKRSFATTPA
jgi:uncharacterized protein